MAKQATLFETDGTLVTLKGTASPRRRKALARLARISRGAVLVRDGLIEAVGPRAALRRRAPKAQRVDLGDGLVTPGFVDAHNHLPFMGSRAFELDLKLQGRSYLQILAAGGGIHHTVAATRKASVNAIAKACRQRLDLMLASGTTTSEAKSGYGLAWAHERKQLLAVRAVAESHPIRLVPTFLGAHVVPKGVDRKTYVDQIVTTMIPQVAAQDLARFCDVFMEAKAFTAAETKRILRSALEHGLRTKLHADEFTDRHGAALGVALGCQSVDHLLHIGDDGVKALSSSPTVAVLLPFVHRSSFEARTAPARDLIESGAAVALGTDFNPNNHNPSMLEAFRAAVYDLRMRPAEAMTAATINSAHALAEGRQTGTIEAGKRADFVSWDVTDIEELAYRQGENPRRLSVLSGQVHVA